MSMRARVCVWEERSRHCFLSLRWLWLRAGGVRCVETCGVVGEAAARAADRRAERHVVGGERQGGGGHPAR
eukprot:1311482-Rhodomonas_salina.1